MKVAAIDIGTNSMRLLIADYEDGKFKEREKHTNTTRIGESVDENGLIDSNAMERNVEALYEFTKLARDKGCEQIWAVGTSALRDSKNSDEFIKKALDKSGISVEIVSGSIEADLGFMGALEGIKGKDENILVLDIGGGSTEFIVGNRHGIQFMKSENVGALRMTEKFLKMDPINVKEYMRMENHISSEIEDTLSEVCKYNIKKVVGIGGTITSVASMLLNMEIYDMEKVHSTVITYSQICNLLERLKMLKTSEREMVRGLQPKRADIITAGVGILEIVLRKICFEKIVVSEYDNLEGLIAKKARI